MSWEAIFEIIAGIAGLGALVYIVFAPVKIGKPYLDGTEVLGPEPKDGGRY
jgi:hypothetical protein